MKKVLLLLMGLIVLGCSKSEDREVPKAKDISPTINTSMEKMSIKCRDISSLSINIKEQGWRISKLDIENTNIARFFSVRGEICEIVGLKKGTTNLIIQATDSQKVIEKKIEIDVIAVGAEKITLKEKIFVPLGKEKSIEFSVTPEDFSEDVVWISNNENIATVSNGNVKGKASGDCIISVSIGSLKAECVVTVKDIIKLKSFPEKWSNLKYETDEHFKYMGNIFKDQVVNLELESSSNNVDINWEVPNTEFISINNNKLTGIKTTETPISIKGTNSNGGYVEIQILSVRNLEDLIKLDRSTATFFTDSGVFKELRSSFSNETGEKIKIISLEVIDAYTNTSLTTIEYNTFDTDVEYSTNRMPLTTSLFLIYKWKYSYNDKIYYKTITSY